MSAPIDVFIRLLPATGQRTADVSQFPAGHAPWRTAVRANSLLVPGLGWPGHVLSDFVCSRTLVSEGLAASP